MSQWGKGLHYWCVGRASENRPQFLLRLFLYLLAKLQVASDGERRDGRGVMGLTI